MMNKRSAKYPKNVTITEVGPRDGLQNESSFVATEHKIKFINMLVQSGLQNIEVTSFVSPHAIPQLADCEAVFDAIEKPAHVHFSALVPNEIGMQKALVTGVKEIAIFTAASESFNQHNINCSISESISRIAAIMALAKTHKIHVRGYISCVLGCPYEGDVSPDQVLQVAQPLLDLGIDEISFGDTIGVGTPKQTNALISSLESIMPLSKVAMHFHDTYGMAIVNIHTALMRGVQHFDSSVAGLGGCPYAQGATGNVATADVLYLMHGLGIEPGIDIFKIVNAGEMICQIIGRKNQSKVANALLANPC